MSIPKEKAKELVEKYLNTIIHFPYIDTEDGSCIGTGYMTHNSAVRCAIISVEEMLNVQSCLYSYNTGNSFVSHKEYWTLVKEELLKR